MARGDLRSDKGAEYVRQREQTKAQRANNPNQMPAPQQIRNNEILSARRDQYVKAHRAKKKSWKRLFGPLSTAVRDAASAQATKREKRMVQKVPGFNLIGPLSKARRRAGAR